MSDSIYELADEIALRLGMYIGKTSLERLSCFIYGYLYAQDSCCSKASVSFDHNNFANWVRKKYGYPSSSIVAGWEKTVLAISLGIQPDKVDWNSMPKELTEEEHQRSVEVFFKLLRDYRDEGV